MPILMVAHSTISNVNFSDSEICEESQPLDFTMSKFKSSSPTKHPLYRQFFGSNSGASPEHDHEEQQGECHLEPSKRVLDGISLSLGRRRGRWTVCFAKLNFFHYETCPLLPRVAENFTAKRHSESPRPPLLSTHMNREIIYTSLPPLAQ